jgi:CheY-like chemotaxis protein
VEHPAGGIARVIAHARLLRSDGIIVLSGGFSYPGSSFTATLTSKEGDSLSVRGTVVACRHVEGIYHELKIKFGQRIDPHLFIEPAQSGSDEEVATVDLSNLRGKVLHLDDSDADGRLLAHFLRGSGIELKSVLTSEEALAHLGSAMVDIFLCDLNLGAGKDALPVVESATKAGFCGPTVILTAENNPTKLAAVKAAGIEFILPKPYQKNALVQLMIKLHQQVGAISSGQAIYSTLSDQADADEMLAAYVPSIQTLAQDLQKKMIARDLAGVR